MKLVTVFEKPELDRLQSSVVVEGWMHVQYGKGRRMFHKEFNEKERKKARVLYNIFYRWHLVSGIPEEHRMTIRTYEFSKRLCNFFGSL